ncbi:hypothetical protein QBC43DRAFT_354543 [Cladorrhinum sp. PSN259]|nr:hypothetical protein QBC43DRAFT_354543 [Cladorrhinum sp. PSN259]
MSLTHSQSHSQTLSNNLPLQPTNSPTFTFSTKLNHHDDCYHHPRHSRRGHHLCLSDGGVGSDIDFSTTGAGIRCDLRSPYPVAFGPGSGQFVVCNDVEGVPRAVKYVEVKLFARCATLPEIKPEAISALGLQIQSTPCYTNVAEVDWSQYYVGID